MFVSRYLHYCVHNSAAKGAHCRSWLCPVCALRSRAVQGAEHTQLLPGAATAYRLGYMRRAQLMRKPVEPGSGDDGRKMLVFKLLACCRSGIQRTAATVFACARSRPSLDGCLLDRYQWKLWRQLVRQLHQRLMLHTGDAWHHRIGVRQQHTCPEYHIHEQCMLMRRLETQLSYVFSMSTVL